VKPDARKAAEWIGKAAEQGDALAEGNFGFLFEHGEGVTIDYPEAYKWYQLAAAHGAPSAKQAMKSLARVMTPKQLREGQFRTSIWRQRSTTSATSTGIGEMESVGNDGVKISD
jgi:TPR repeat protein